MIKLAFCDDEIAILNQIRSLLDQYRVKRNQEIEYTAYQSPLELLAGIEKGLRYDILFLDVMMPGENGISAAKEIREYDSNVNIIFLTSSTEFAVQSYTVEAYFYQLKPIWGDSFFRLMDSVIEQCEKAQTDSLILRCKDGITRVSIGQLEYCEVIGRSLLLHLTTGRVLESTGSLDELGGQLTQYKNFQRLHRSYLVNLDCIQGISYRAITMSCMTEIPVPHGKYAELKKIFLEHAFSSGQVML